MHTLRDYLDAKISAGKKLLSIYLTAGYPTPEATLPLLEAIAQGGADLIELGVPFSDPLADGPTIQQASQIALKNGMTVAGALNLLKEFRRRHSLPVLLMGYANPFMQFGWERLVAEAAKAGAAGFIVPDLPPEESDFLHRLLKPHRLTLVYLAAPNTPTERLQRIDRLTGGFIYAVSLTGVTGAREQLPPETEEFLIRLRQVSGHPLLVGFGISGPESAARLAPYCDGIIVGSALIRRIEDSPDVPTAVARVREFVAGLRTALE